jgi:hypothetical protein
LELKGEIMALPKQVEQQLKEIEEMEKALTVEPEGQPETQEPVEPTVEAQPTEPVEPVAVETKVEDDWAQKYRTLKGHFDAEVPRLHQQNKELVNQLQQLQEHVRALSEKPQQQQTQDERLVTDKDEEAFGADLIDVQRRIAKEVMRDLVAPMKKELEARDSRIAQLETMLTKTSGDVTTLTFEQRLERAIPDFTTINTDPKWVAWLDEADPYTNLPRRNYAEYVYSQGDVEKLKQIVEFYKTASGQSNVNAERQQRQTELNRQVQPTRTASASSVPQGQKLYTESDAARLFHKVRELNLKGKYDEASQLEAELSAAYVEGRVRG